jgi:hypothetical protein
MERCCWNRGNGKKCLARKTKVNGRSEPTPPPIENATIANQQGKIALYIAKDGVEQVDLDAIKVYSAKAKTVNDEEVEANYADRR